MLSLTASCGDDAHEGHAESPHDKHSGGEIVLTKHQAEAAGVETEKVSAGSFREVLKTSGRVLPGSGREQAITAPVAGMVRFASRSLTPGMEVSSGISLFTISTQGMAQSATASAAISELRLAQQAYDRAKELAGSKVVTAAELEAAEARLRSARAMAGAADVKAATGAVAVSSPISGAITTVDVTPGAYVEAGARLATVTSDRVVRLRADVSERHAASLRNVSDANIVIPSDPGNTLNVRSHGGHLSASSVQPVDGSHYIPVTFEMNNPGTLISGSCVEIYLLGNEKQGVISVPVDALVEEMGGYCVYLRTGEDVYEKRHVKRGASDGMRVEITDGLKAGDEVVTRGAYTVKMASQSSSVPAHSHHH